MHYFFIVFLYFGFYEHLASFKIDDNFLKENKPFVEFVDNITLKNVNKVDYKKLLESSTKKSLKNKQSYIFKKIDSLYRQKINNYKKKLNFFQKLYNSITFYRTDHELKIYKMIDEREKLKKSILKLNDYYLGYLDGIKDAKKKYANKNVKLGYFLTSLLQVSVERYDFMTQEFVSLEYIEGYNRGVHITSKKLIYQNYTIYTISRLIAIRSFFGMLSW